MEIIFVEGPQFVEEMNNPEGWEIYDRLCYLSPSEAEKEHHYFSVIDGKKIGVISFEISPYNKKQLWLKHIAVDDEHKNQGVANALIIHAFDDLPSRFPEQNGLVISSFSDEGEMFIRHKMEEHDYRIHTMIVKYPEIEEYAVGIAF